MRFIRFRVNYSEKFKNGLSFSEYFPKLNKCKRFHKRKSLFLKENPTGANPEEKSLISREFCTIPVVAKKIAENFYNPGLRSVKGLANRNPEERYFRLCNLKGKEVDRCMLYVICCAVYFASNKAHNPELLNWWKWKD